MPDNPLANPWRGEVPLALNGEIFLLRPSFAALSAIEQELDTGLFALARKLAEGAVSLRDLVAIMRRCAVSARLPEPLEETLLAAGLTAVMEAATALLAHAFAGFYDRESHGE